MNQHSLFTKVQDYYADLVLKLGTAQHEISMTYLSFDDGDWATKISDVLCSKALSGVKVRLMVDEFGQVLDEPQQRPLIRRCLSKESSFRNIIF